MKSFTFVCGLLKVFLVIHCAATDSNGHKFHTLTSKRTQSVAQCVDSTSFEEILPNILKVRVPDTPGHTEVKNYIISQLNELDCSRWNITLDTFQSHTPVGEKTFTNIIATLDPEKSKRLVLAAHYDSKMTPEGFLGAIDSAVPVALILDVILTLSKKLEQRELQDYSLQIIFFDGEEAFVTWTSEDSLYGSRHLAEAMSKPDGPLSVDGKTGIEAMETLILLDLIGSSDTNFYKMSDSSGSKHYDRLERIETRLEEVEELHEYPNRQKLLKDKIYRYAIQDDHKPFQERGVPIVHLISVPFPTVWHKLSDNYNAINMHLVTNFKKILIVFLNEYFHLR